MATADYIKISAPPFATALPLRQRIFILVLAVVAHGVLLAQPWLAIPGLSGHVPRELSVSIVQMSSSRLIPASRSARAMPPVVEHKPPEQVNDQSRQPAMPQSDGRQLDAGQTETGQTAVPQNNETTQPAASVLPDREPDYRAVYFNNPQPEYPLPARRMGWQGRVVINVEVLADGSPGEIDVQQSSGREILDNAALRAVRGWRFVPARKGRQTVAQRFLVPIAFNLKESE